MFKRLTYFFNELGGDFLHAKEFLMRIGLLMLEEFPEYYEPNEKKHPVFLVNNSMANLSFGLNMDKDTNIFSESVKAGLKNLSSDQMQERFHYIRKELRDHQQIYHRCSTQLAGVPKSKVGNLYTFRSDLDRKISLLKKKSIFIAYEIAAKIGFKRLDLHGLYLEEAQELVMIALDAIKKIMFAKNQRRYS